MNDSSIPYPTAQELYEFAQAKNIRLCTQVSIRFSRLPLDRPERPIVRACPSALLAIKIFGDQRYRGLFSGFISRIYDQLEYEAGFPFDWPRELDQGYAVHPLDHTMNRVLTHDRIS